MSADRGPWFMPKQAAPLLGLTTRQVQALCVDRQIDHRLANPDVNRRRFLISQQAIDRYIVRTTIRAASVYRRSSAA